MPTISSRCLPVPNDSLSSRSPRTSPRRRQASQSRRKATSSKPTSVTSMIIRRATAWSAVTQARARFVLCPATSLKWPRTTPNGSRTWSTDELERQLDSACFFFFVNLFYLYELKNKKYTHTHDGEMFNGCLVSIPCTNDRSENERCVCLLRSSRFSRHYRRWRLTIVPVVRQDFRPLPCSSLPVRARCHRRISVLG